jgi:hypothetical protein
MNTTKLVLISEGNDYKRYVGSEMTNHIISDERLLTLQEIEQFRADPKLFLEG